ncbi:MAG: FeoB small GTPase domain-containing protein [Acidimicrobiia bacterium]
MAGRAHCRDDGHDATRSGGDGVIVALVGNPDTGKSSIFNHLTGARQHIGNWPGKTVSKAHGSFARDGADVQLVDLPGTYSLNASSPEEMIARDYLVNGRPEAVIVVADASNLERNLYLVVQVLEMGIHTIVALNMVDVAESYGIKVDAGALAERLGAPVIPTVARSGDGLDALRDAVVRFVTTEHIP